MEHPSRGLEFRDLSGFAVCALVGFAAGAVYATDAAGAFGNGDVGALVGGGADVSDSDRRAACAAAAGAAYTALPPLTASARWLGVTCGHTTRSCFTTGAACL